MFNKKLAGLTAILAVIASLIYFNTVSAGTSEITISGEVIDVSCYLANGDDGKGPEHKECAIICAKAGSALAILTSNGEVYFPVGPMGKNNNDKLLNYAGDNVKVQGIKISQGNLLGIKISSIEVIN